MKTQLPNLRQYLKDILNILSQSICCDFMNTKDRQCIEFISLNVKCPNVNTHAHFPTVGIFRINIYRLSLATIQKIIDY